MPGGVPGGVKAASRDLSNQERWMDQRDGWNSQGGLRQEEERPGSQELQEASQEMPGLHANRKVKEGGIERRSGLEGAQRPAGTTLLRVTSQVPAPAYGWYWDRAPVQKQSEQGRQSTE